MWGNRLGWGVSAAIALLAIAFGAWLHAQLEVTAPTELSLDPANLAVLSPPAAPWEIVQQDQPGDAGPLYRSALTAYADSSAACDDFVKDPSGTPPQPIQQV